jgi:hypothetical protein
MPILFAGTLFVSALLLFMVQPLIAKMILPLLGGSPAVWNTCMVFFQAALLAGYLYAHGATRWLSTRTQVVVHLGLLCLPFLVLPIGIYAADGNPVLGAPPESAPVGWLLALLTVVVGLPFFVVATSAPLLQKWFAGSGHRSAGDPYFLYAASNLGSMVALLGYPFLLEPVFRLSEQSTLWTVGYGCLLLLTATCAVVAWRSGVTMPAVGDAPAGEPAAFAPVEPVAPVTFGRRLRWVALAALPSGLMLAVTTYITTDVAAIPLLWVVPLAVYLLTFILVFAQRPLVPHALVLKALPILTLLILFLVLTHSTLLVWQMIPLQWLVLFVGAMACHGELARDRPSTAHLTEFYLAMSVGGVVGGMFAALVAPQIFQAGIVEYPLLLLLACLARPDLWPAPARSRWIDLLLPLGVAVLAAAMVVGLKAQFGGVDYTLQRLACAVLMFVCFTCADRPLRFVLTAGAVCLAVVLANPRGVLTQYTERNFFGVVTVLDDPVRRLRQLRHGSTMHGLQALDESGQLRRPPEPLAYFTRSGPFGQVFTMLRKREQPALLRVGVFGLGVGSQASYARPGEEWTFYEIDPAMERVAADPRYFTYLTDSPTKNIRILLGDARLRLREAPDRSYDLLVMDAFGSDSVPAHLLTREALDLYLTKLAPGGVLVFNISNRYLGLRPVLADLALSTDPPLVCFAQEELDIPEADLEAGKLSSHWLVMARRLEDLGDLVNDPRWQRQEQRSGAPLWTDDASNILQVLKW